MDGALAGEGGIRLSLVRDFELRYAGTVLNVAPASQRLIGFLALQGRPVRRAYVSGTLWLDAAEARAGASMRSALWRLPAPSRTAIVGTSSTHIWLNPTVEVDLTRMATQALAALDDRIAGPDRVRVARELSAFGDDLLPGWDDDWVMTERERFRQLRLHALDRLGDQLLAAQQHSDALQVGLVSVAAEPLRESGHRLLMRTHLSEGNIAEALRQYHALARLLDSELGVRPSTAMEALLRECLGGPTTRQPRIRTTHIATLDRQRTAAAPCPTP